MLNNMIFDGTWTPSAVKDGNNALTCMFERYLLEKAISRFEFTMPEIWAENYFNYTLFLNGVVCILNTKEFGVIPQHCSLTGLNVFYQPAGALISNHLLLDYHGRPLKIGKECEIIKLRPDLNGIYDIVHHYAAMMAQAMESVDVNIINSKFAYVFMANNKAAAESFKKMFDKILAGEPAVFMDKELFTAQGDPAWLQFVNNLKQNYIAGDLLEDVKKIEAQFNTIIGIPNVNIAKASGVSPDEVQANNEDTFSHVSLWLSTMQKDIKKVNKMFPDLNLNVNLREYEGGVADGEIIDPRDVQTVS